MNVANDTSYPEPQNAAFIRDENGDAKILHVFGDIDLANAHEFEATIERINLAHSPRLVIDLTGCTYIDSTGLRVVVRARKHFGDRLRIVVPSGSQLRRVFEITGLAQELALLPSLEQSLTH